MRGIVTGLFGLILLAGCSLHSRQEVTHDLQLPDRYVKGKGDTRTELQVGRWWERFDDTDLNRLIEEALAYNLDLEQAVARLQQSEALLKSATAARYPALTVSGAASTGSQPGITGDTDGENYSLSVAAAFELDLWGKNRAKSLAARYDLEAAGLEFRALQLSLSARVGDAYFLLVEQRSQLQLAEESIAAYRQSLEMVERRYRNGLVPAVDLYQARQNLATARSGREATATALALAEHAVAVLVGRYPGEKVAGELSAIPSPPEAFPAGLPSELLSRRPDLRAAQLRVRAHDERLEAAIADRFPSINLLGSYGASRNTYSSPATGGDFWSLAAGLTQPILDGGRRRAETDRQRGVVAESLAGYRQSVLDAFREVEDALAKNFNAERRVDHLEAAEAAAANALRLSLERYRYGLTEYLPVVTSQVFHFQIQGNLIAARRQLLSDRISLVRALGGDWGLENNQQETNRMNGDEK